jgi:hypothetical protein
MSIYKQRDIVLVPFPFPTSRDKKFGLCLFFRTTHTTIYQLMS